MSLNNDALESLLKIPAIIYTQAEGLWLGAASLHTSTQQNMLKTEQGLNGLDFLELYSILILVLRKTQYSYF